MAVIDREKAEDPRHVERGDAITGLVDACFLSGLTKPIAAPDRARSNLSPMPRPPAVFLSGRNAALLFMAGQLQGKRHRHAPMDASADAMRDLAASSG